MRLTDLLRRITLAAQQKYIYSTYSGGDVRLQGFLKVTQHANTDELYMFHVVPRQKQCLCNLEFRLLNEKVRVSEDPRGKEEY